MRVPAKRKDPQRCGSFFICRVVFAARTKEGADVPPRYDGVLRSTVRRHAAAVRQCRCDVRGTGSAFAAGGVSASSLLRAQKNRSGR